MRRCFPLAALASLLLCFAAQAESRKLTVLATGDNRGDITHCGCTTTPTGGLSRRKSVVDQARAGGETLLLDAGNALFRDMGESNAAKAKAEFILRTMGELRTTAMAVGLWDLPAGPEFLKKAASKANVKLLSANLTLKGKRLFEPSTVVTVGGSRIGIVGVGPEIQSPDFPGLLGAPPVPAALAEVKKLQGTVDVVIVLAAIPYEEVLQLSKEAGTGVDLIFQASDKRQPTVPKQEHSSFIISTGRRGQMVARVELELSGKGPLVDLGQLAREEQTLLLLDKQVAETRKRQASAREPSQQKGFEETLKGFESRRAQVQSNIAGLRSRSGRSLLLTPVLLGPDVADDPELKAKVDAIEPPGTAVKEPPP